jgi:hypothetical protein
LATARATTRIASPFFQNNFTNGVASIMKLQDIVPELSELALSTFSVTSPYAKVAGCGLGLTILARNSIQKRLFRHCVVKCS